MLDTARVPHLEETDKPATTADDVLAAFEAILAAMVGHRSTFALAELVRDAHMLWASVCGHVGRGQAPGKKGGGKAKAKSSNLNFFAYMAERVGTSKTTLRRLYKIASGLCEQAKAIIRTSKSGISNECTLLLGMIALGSERQIGVAQAGAKSIEAAKHSLAACSSIAVAVKPAIPPTAVRLSRSEPYSIPRKYRRPQIRLICVQGLEAKIEILEGPTIQGVE